MAAIKKGKPQGTTNYSDDIKRLISSTYSEHKDWSAPRVHQAIKVVCKSNQWKCPSESKVRKDIANIELKLKNESRLKPWSLASVSKYPAYFPPDAIPFLLELTGQGSGPPAYPRYIPTVWVAIWIVRLHKIPNFNLDIAEWYAMYEQSCELAGLPCDTSHFDGKDGEDIARNINNYLHLKDNIFKSPSGRTAFADQRHFDRSLMTRIVIETDKIEGRTLNKGKHPQGFSKELKEDIDKSGNVINRLEKEGESNG